MIIISILTTYQANIKKYDTDYNKKSLYIDQKLGVIMKIVIINNKDKFYGSCAR